MVVVDAEIGFCCNLYILYSNLHGSSSADERGGSQYELPESGCFAYVLSFFVVSLFAVCANSPFQAKLNFLSN
jgi:hypothetical protein